MNEQGIQRLIDSGFRVGFTLAGGGSGALHALLSTPGASRLVTGATVPYSPEALARRLGAAPRQAVSPETARALAEQGWQEQSGIGPPGRAMHVACTAALRTDRVRRGDDRAMICIRTDQAERLYALFLSSASRAQQEALLSRWLLHLTAQVCGTEPFLVHSGSYNPVHRGHFKMLAAAEEITGRTGFFELSCRNTDKPTADSDECLCRASAIRDIPVALTDAPRFIEKAVLFPGAVFVVGYDTAARLLRDAQPGVWAQFRDAGIRFLVAGRQIDGRFLALDDLPVPEEAAPLFDALPTTVFREDICSTDLRATTKPDKPGDAP